MLPGIVPSINTMDAYRLSPGGGSSCPSVGMARCLRQSRLAPGPRASLTGTGGFRRQPAHRIQCHLCCRKPLLCASAATLERHASLHSITHGDTRVRLSALMTETMPFTWLPAFFPPCSASLLGFLHMLTQSWVHFASLGQPQNSVNGVRNQGGVFVMGYTTLAPDISKLHLR